MRFQNIHYWFLAALAFTSACKQNTVSLEQTPCNYHDDCTSEGVCRMLDHICVPRDQFDDISPQLENTIRPEPAIGRTGTKFSITVQADEALGMPPEVFLSGSNLREPWTLDTRTTTASRHTYGFTYTTTGNEPSGVPLTIEVILVDAFGNRTRLEAGTITVDTRKPKVTDLHWETALSAVSSQSTVSFSGNIDTDAIVTSATLVDPTGQVLRDILSFVHVDANKQISGQIDLRGIPLATTLGLVVQLHLADAAGNTSDEMLSRTPPLWIDDTPPDLLTVIPSRATRTAQTNLTLLINTAHADEIFIDGDIASRDATPMGVWFPAHFPWEQSLQFTGSDGQKYIHVKVRDHAGNVTQTDLAFVLDRQPIPNDTTVILPAGQRALKSGDIFILDGHTEIGARVENVALLNDTGQFVSQTSLDQIVHNDGRFKAAIQVPLVLGTNTLHARITVTARDISASFETSPVMVRTMPPQPIPASSISIQEELTSDGIIAHVMLDATQIPNSINNVDIILPSGARVQSLRDPTGFSAMTLPRSTHFAFVATDDSLQSSITQTLELPALTLSAVPALAGPTSPLRVLFQSSKPLRELPTASLAGISGAIRLVSNNLYEALWTNLPTNIVDGIGRNTITVQSRVGSPTESNITFLAQFRVDIDHTPPEIKIEGITFSSKMTPGEIHKIQGQAGCIRDLAGPDINNLSTYPVRVDVLNEANQTIATTHSQSDGSFGPIALPNIAGFIHLQVIDTVGNVLSPERTWLNEVVPPVDTQGPTVQIALAQDPWDPSPGVTGTARDVAGVGQVLIAVRDTSTNKWFGTAFDQTAQVWKKANMDEGEAWHRMLSEIVWRNNIRYEIQCRADDTRGNSTIITHSFKYTARAPAPPTGIALTKLGDGQLWLTWTPNGRSNTVWIADNGADNTIWPEYKATSTDGIVRIDTLEDAINIWVVGRSAEGDGHFGSPLHVKPRHWIALSDPSAAPHAPAMQPGPCDANVCSILEALLGAGVDVLGSVFWENAWVAIASNGALWFSPDDGEHWLQDTKAPNTAYALVVEDVLIAVDMQGDVFALR